MKRHVAAFTGHRNHFLVDHTSTLLAVYNGERQGGTAATIRYAQKLEREIILIDPSTLCIAHIAAQAG